MAVIEQDYVGFGIDPKTGKRHALNHLPKVAEWQDAIYQYEQKDKLIGGVDGIDNLQGQELANRTEYLKAQTDAHAERIKKIEDEGAGGAGVPTFFEIDTSGGIMPSENPAYSDNFELDASGAIMPKE